MREALFYKKIENQRVQCDACNHRCIISPGNKGICGVRENKDGKLYSLVYGKAIAKHIDPIEKKPLFHFLPGSTSLSFATIGCNFRCLHCQNADISQAPREDIVLNWGENISPDEIVKEALENNCQSISYTYTEPTIFIEYALETMKLAKEKGLKNIWVSNGYMTEKVIRALTPYLDAANIDLKFFSDDIYQKVCGAKLEPILENLKLIKKLNVWLEVTTLIIPTFTDIDNQLKQIAQFIVWELGKETPWHISRFYPAYKLTDIPPTPLETIHKAYEIGREIGLKYVYTGNILGDEGENTYCPKCEKLAVDRFGYNIKRYDADGICVYCGENLDLILK